MYGQKVRQLAGVFVDAQSIVYGAKSVAAVLDVFRDDGFIVPQPAREQTPSGPVERITLGRVGGGLQLLFLGSRFDVWSTPLSPEDDSNMASYDAFLPMAGDLLARALQHFERKGHRLAAVQEGFLPEVDESRMDVVCDRLFRRPPTFDARPTFEWDYRLCAHVPRQFGDQEEITNAIITAKRQSGQFVVQDKGLIPFDRLRLDIDINTIPQDVSPRFGSKEVRAYFTQASSWHMNLAAEATNFLLGDS